MSAPTADAPILGWRVDDGECWWFVRETTRGRAKRHVDTYHDLAEPWRMAVIRVPKLDGTGPAGVVYGDELERLTGWHTCTVCEWRHTITEPCEECAADWAERERIRARYPDGDAVGIPDDG